MLNKVIEENHCSLDVTLAWCLNAKNTLKNLHGFSPFQLAIGQNWTLDPNTSKLVLYTDASFTNLPDGGNLGGHLIFLTNFYTKCCPLIWNSSKDKRIVCSTLAAETLALNEGYETALYLSQILGEISHLKHIPITCLTDNKSLYDITNSLTLTTDRLLWVEITTIRQLCERKQVTLKWVEGKHQLSNCLTKKGASPLCLQHVLNTGQL